MGVVDDAQHGGVLSHLGQQAQDREEHEKPVADRFFAFAEGGPQGLALWGRQSSDVFHDRPEQPVQCRERQRRLRFDALRPENLHPLRRRDRVGQQDRLADSGLSAQHQASGPGRPRLIEQRPDPVPFDFATV